MANLIEELSAQARALLRRTGFDWPSGLDPVFQYHRQF